MPSGARDRRRLRKEIIPADGCRGEGPRISLGYVAKLAQIWGAQHVNWRVRYSLAIRAGISREPNMRRPPVIHEVATRPKSNEGTGAMIKRLLKWSAILAIGLQLGGCFTDYGPVVSDSAPVAPTAVATRIQPGDQLKIIIYGEDALSGLYEVSPAGSISLPLVGSVLAAGRTKSDVEHTLTREYADRKFLQDPKITVSVVSFRPFFVLGEVTAPGQYPYKSGIDVLSAVATAGGFTYRASRNSVLIRHAGDDVWQEYSVATPVPIAPGDLIRVPERYF